MQVTMQTTIPYFNAILSQLASMSAYFDRYPKKVIPQSGLPDEIPRIYYLGEKSDRVCAGMHSMDDGNKVVYIRSSGNWLLLDKEAVEITYSGRRHSLQEILYSVNGMFPQTHVVGWKYFQTQEPDLAPWETTT